MAAQYVALPRSAPPIRSRPSARAQCGDSRLRAGAGPQSQLHGFSIAHALVLVGEPARSVEAANRQMRLDPFYGPLVPAALGMAHYVLQQYSEACRRWGMRSPGTEHAYWPPVAGRHLRPVGQD
jgi:hypothetical protein